MLPIVVVFGSSRPREGTVTYDEARDLGGLLAQSGYIVSTGAYRGVMEAASRGASEAGGHVIGVSCDQIETMVPGLQVNQWVVEEIRYSDLRGRLHHLVVESQAAIAMPGGIGTLLEIAYTWGLLQCEEIPSKKLIVVGEPWSDIANTLMDQNGDYVDETHRMLLKTVDTVAEAVAELEKA